jgi:hypothetical protein
MRRRSKLTKLRSRKRGTDLGNERLNHTSHDARQDIDGGQQRVRTEGRDGELLVVVGGVPLERVGIAEQTEGAIQERYDVSDGM